MYNVEEIVFPGGGQIFWNGRFLGMTEGDIVLVKTETTKPVDFITQKPGAVLDRRVLGATYFIRMNLVSSTLENLKEALRTGPIEAGQGVRRIRGGSEPPENFVKKAPLEIYGLGPNGSQRKFYAYKAGVVDPGEINFIPAREHQTIPVTFQLFPNPQLPPQADCYYIEETTIPT